MKIAVVIETKDRRIHGKKNYLGQTLQNLHRAGLYTSPAFHSLQIVSGGELPDFAAEIEPFIPAGEVVDYYDCPAGGLTRQQNGMRAIYQGGQTDADWVLKLEDDLDFVNDFLGSVERWLLDYGGHASPNSGMYSPMFVLGCSFEKVSDARYLEAGESILGPGRSFPRARGHLAQFPGVYAMRHPVLGFYGAQALLWRRPVAEQLAAWLGPDPFLWDGQEAHRDRGHDLMMQAWGQHMHADCFVCAIPAFVQHIGDQSNIDNPFLQFPWPGRDWTYTRRS